MSRILRSLVCLLLICCILVNLSPLNARATGAGAAALGIVKATSISVPALWPIVAALAVVGVTAYGIESGAFENIANSCYSALESAGTWINNGMADILRTEDADGNVQYYVDGAMISDVKNWVYSDTATSSGPVVYEGDSFAANRPANSYFYCGASDFQYSTNIPCLFVSSYCLEDSNKLTINYLIIASSVFRYTTKSGNSVSSVKYSSTSSNGYEYVWDTVAYTYKSSAQLNDYMKYLNLAGAVQVSAPFTTSTSMYEYFFPSFSYELESDYDLTLGYLPDRDTVLDDETIVTFHPYLADVIRTRTGGSGGSGEDDNKWWLAVAYAETLEKLYQTSQQAQIENPSVVEIPDLQEGTQYEVTVEEDEDGNKKYILNPIYDPGTNPGTGTDPGTGDGTDTDPDTGTDSGNGSGNTGTDSGSTGNTGSTWKPPSDPTHFKLVDLSKFFPFCIPFDLFDFFKLLNADPVAPSFTWEIQDLSGQTYGLTVDLSQWDSVAQLFRRLQLFLFVCGLAAASRKFIKW